MSETRTKAELEDAAIQIATERSPLASHLFPNTPTDEVRTIIGLVRFVRSLDEELTMNDTITPEDMGYFLWDTIKADNEAHAIQQCVDRLKKFGTPADEIRAVNAGGGKWRVWVKYDEGA